MDDIIPWLALAGIVFGPTSAVVATLKVTVNGMRRDVTETREDCKAIRSTLSDHGDRLVKIETRMEDPR